MSITAAETSSFVEFPDRRGVLDRLRSIEVYEIGMEPMFHLVADRLESRAYDRSAFVFILLELIYEFEEDTITFSDLLGRMVFALAGDLDLVGEALEAFEEICVTLAPAPEPVPEPVPEPIPETAPELDEGSAPVDSASEEKAEGLAGIEHAGSGPGGHDRVAELWGDEADREHMMLELQQTQKRLLDFGLATRLSIEIALGRPTRANVQQTLRDMGVLRQSLLRFEELLQESERRILEAIGVLDRDLP